MNSDVMTYSPANLSTEDIEACISVVTNGCAVNPRSAAAELPHAMVVAVTREGQDIVGVGVIKRKRPQYASDIARKSGFRFDKNIHELGYVAVKESHRGLGLSHEITVKLLATFRDRPLFATTSNEYMKRTLEKVGFVRRGDEWPGKNGALSLWIKNAGLLK